MNDLVERLRASTGGGKHYWIELEAEAADEIERLTTELVRISVLNAEHIEVNETALHDRLLLSQENHKLATELGKWLKECGRLTAENEALKTAFGQPVPLSEWQQLTVERDRWEQNWRTQTLTINRLVAAAEDRNEVDATRAKLHQEDLDKLIAEHDAALVDAKRWRWWTAQLVKQDTNILEKTFKSLEDKFTVEQLNALTDAAIAKETL